MRNKLYIIQTFARNGVGKLIARRMMLYYLLCIALLLSQKILFSVGVINLLNVVLVFILQLLLS